MLKDSSASFLLWMTLKLQQDHFEIAVAALGEGF